MNKDSPKCPPCGDACTVCLNLQAPPNREPAHSKAIAALLLMSIWMVLHRPAELVHRLLVLGHV
jgi:hypothetical protein